MDELEMGEESVRKEGRSAAFKEIQEMLARMEMKKHMPAAPAPEAPMMEPEAEEPAGSGLTPEEIAELQAQLESLKE